MQRREYFGFLWEYRLSKWTRFNQDGEDCEVCWRPLPPGTRRWVRLTSAYSRWCNEVPDILCAECQFDLGMSAWEVWVEETYPWLWAKIKAKVEGGAIAQRERAPACANL